MQQTVGRQIQDSPEIQTAIQNLVNAVMEKSKAITGIRAPQAGLEQTYKQYIETVQSSRGRELYYPFLGSGAGRGAYVELMDGSVKLDLINGIGIHLVGHSHPKIMAATVKGALSDAVMQGNLEPNHEYMEFGSRLVRLASRKSRLKHFWPTTCGAMANENALKIARQKHSPARMIVAMQSAFAGRSTMMAEITDNPGFKIGLPQYNEVLRIPFYDKNDPQSSEKSLRALKEHVAKHPKDVCCFTFEPVQGEGGFNVAPREFFVPMMEFCREQKIAVWADEVQTFSRTGELFAFETLEIGDYIDICTIAKTAQNGATLYTSEYNPQPGLISGTFSGSSASLAAGIAVLDLLETGGYFGPQGRIAQIHKEFVGMLNRLNETTCKGQLRDAGGLGLMVAVTPLDGSKEVVNKILQNLFKKGLIAFSCGKGPVRIRFLLPLVLTSEDIAVASQVLETTIQELG